MSISSVRNTFSNVLKSFEDLGKSKPFPMFSHYQKFRDQSKNKETIPMRQGEIEIPQVEGSAEGEDPEGWKTLVLQEIGEHLKDEAATAQQQRSSSGKPKATPPGGRPPSPRGQRPPLPLYKGTSLSPSLGNVRSYSEGKEGG